MVRKQITQYNRKQILRRALLLCALLTLCVVMSACGGGAGTGGSSSAESAESVTEADIEKANEEAKKLAEEISDHEINVLLGSKADIEDLVQKKAEELLGTVKIKVSGKYDVNKVSKYDLKVTLEEKKGAKASETFTLSVIDRDQMEGDYNFITDKGFLAEVKDGIMSIDGTEIVNKSYSLPPDYGDGLTTETLEAYQKMEAQASIDGIYLQPISEYRSYYDQMYIHAQNAAKYGGEKADTFSAKPGHSEHQLGEAMDLNSLDQSFADTTEGQWISNHCAEYGFILRYPQGKTEETGYMSEPWHVRYVGEDLAKKLYNGGDWITVEDYFGIDSEYRKAALEKEESEAENGSSDGSEYYDESGNYDESEEYGYE